MKAKLTPMSVKCKSILDLFFVPVRLKLFLQFSVASKSSRILLKRKYTKVEEVQFVMLLLNMVDF